ncbi:hypothetical protein DVH24_034105 [Malus domestica]|uniref:Retrotransposon gag domain-containing protein n=1 Tax=Malus domestica TaxID=3750 RepID=A0A498KNW6_MALDO|nr:hypothetical protein DVH24_034105 [Malus domestica]
MSLLKYVELRGLQPWRLKENQGALILARWRKQGGRLGLRSSKNKELGGGQSLVSSQDQESWSRYYSIDKMPRLLTSLNKNRASFDAQEIAEMFRAFQASTNAYFHTNEECIHDQEMSYLDHFMKNKPLKFWGAPEAEKAESWLEHIKKNMRTLHVPPELQVKQIYGGVLYVLSYFPYAMKHTKIQEFLDLKQENMTVAEYVAKFAELSKYSDDIANDKKTKAIKFRQGLRDSVRRHIVGQGRKTYHEIMEAAYELEQDYMFT